MCPTVLHFWGMRVVIYTRDHLPAHIHVIRGNGDAEVKFDLRTWEVISARGLSEGAINKIKRELKPNTDYFLEAWNEIHKEEEKQ